MWKRESLVNLVLVFSPLAIGLLYAAAVSLAPVRVLGVPVCVGFYAAGLSLLLTAKISLFRQRIWVSFGSSQMCQGSRRRYRAAYVLLGAGMVLNVALLLSSLIPV